MMDLKDSRTCPTEEETIFDVAHSAGSVRLGECCIAYAAVSTSDITRLFQANPFELGGRVELEFIARPDQQCIQKGRLDAVRHGCVQARGLQPAPSGYRRAHVFESDLVLERSNASDGRQVLASPSPSAVIEFRHPLDMTPGDKCRSRTEQVEHEPVATNGRTGDGPQRGAASLKLQDVSDCNIG
jgi:hypothetical protein